MSKLGVYLLLLRGLGRGDLDRHSTSKGKTLAFDSIGKFELCPNSGLEKKLNSFVPGHAQPKKEFDPNERGRWRLSQP